MELGKGVDYLIKALHILNSARRERGENLAFLLVAGNGSERDRLQNLANTLDTQDSIVWLGELKLESMPSFYAACDVVVTPSITTQTWREQFGRVPVEAMATGTPVIVSDSGSLPEVVGTAGVIVRERDDHQLAEALTTLLREDRQKRIEDGRRLVLEKYRWKTIADEMLKLYRHCHGYN